jgi:hypothetical protein
MISKSNTISGITAKAALLLIVMLAVTVTSCRVRVSFTGASIHPDIKTISISYFQNRADDVDPSLSQTLTDALVDKCRKQTNLQMVPGIGDVHFEGEITNYRTETLTISGDARAAMNRFTISVRVRFINAMDPEMDYTQVFSRYEDYDSNTDFSQVRDPLSEKIIELIVDDIFNRAFANW